jgi:hypothetical protein
VQGLGITLRLPGHRRFEVRSALTIITGYRVEKYIGDVAIVEVATHCNFLPLLTATRVTPPTPANQSV